MVKEKVKELEGSPMDTIIAQHRDLSIDEMPLDTYQDYKEYNKKARGLNKKAKALLYPCKPCPIELHPKQKIRFARKDQPSNPLKVLLQTDMIDYNETLVPGRVYDLPNTIIKFLNDKGVPIWKWVDKANGEKETTISHYEPRFALQGVFND